MLSDRESSNDASVSDVLASIRQAVESAHHRDFEHAIKTEDAHLLHESADREVLELTHSLEDELELSHSLDHKLDGLIQPKIQDISKNKEQNNIDCLDSNKNLNNEKELFLNEEVDQNLLSIAAETEISRTLGALKKTRAQKISTLNSSSQDDDNLSKALSISVKEILRPLLKTWLDQNLPSIVHDIVTQEIKRLR